jgi:hypothetical protein
MVTLGMNYKKVKKVNRDILGVKRQKHLIISLLFMVTHFRCCGFLAAQKI